MNAIAQLNNESVNPKVTQSKAFNNKEGDLEGRSANKAPKNNVSKIAKVAKIILGVVLLAVTLPLAGLGLVLHPLFFIACIITIPCSVGLISPRFFQGRIPIRNYLPSGGGAYPHTHRPEPRPRPMFADNAPRRARPTATSASRLRPSAPPSRSPMPRPSEGRSIAGSRRTR